MKQVLFFFLILCPFFIFSQSTLPAFGEISREELDMKECDFEKDAAAMILLREGRIAYKWNNENSFKVVDEQRVRIKIFNTRGFSEGDINIPFISREDFEKVTSIQAFAYNTDDKGGTVTTKLEKESVFKDKVNDSRSVMKFSIPGIKAGSVIEYRFIRTSESLKGIPTWVFQSHLPVKISRLTLETPNNFQFTKNVLTLTPADMKTSEYKERVFARSGAEITFNYDKDVYTLEKINSLREEPYMSCLRDYLQRVEFQLTGVTIGDYSKSFGTNRATLAADLMADENFGLELAKQVKIDALDAALKTAATPYQKMVVIHDYFRKNFKWNGDEDFETLSLKKIADKQTGTSGDINLLMINQLMAAGVPVKPLLASSRGHGQVNTSFPFRDQFNNVLALVTLDDDVYVLNGADKYNPVRLIPYDVMASNALVLDGENSDWVFLWNGKTTEKNRVVVQAAISPQGQLEGTATINSYDYAKNPRVKKYTTAKEAFAEAYLGTGGSTLKISNLVVNNLDNDSLPLEQKFSFAQPLNTSGEYAYFSPNLFLGLDKNPFLADSRQTDIFFGYNRFYTIIGQISLPENYTYEELPNPVKMIMPDTSIVFQREFSGNEQMISFRFTLQFDKPVYPVGEYDEFREFYKKLFGMLNEQLVLKKKK